MPPSDNAFCFTIKRNGVRDKSLRLVRLDADKEFAQFSTFCCGDDDLNDFIRGDALAHKKQLIVETYVLKEATLGDPVAFISFCNDSIPLTQLKRNSKKFLPMGKRYDNMPAVKIARLGVRSDLQDNNIGTHMINMTKAFFTSDNRTGCRFITVDAYNTENVRRFYEKNDFQYFRKQDEDKPTRIMYLDLKRFK